jgi:GT2 family glycosyltransferase/glycosyltransferase involved in cell wall biosynthesis
VTKKRTVHVGSSLGLKGKRVRPPRRLTAPSLAPKDGHSVDITGGGENAGKAKNESVDHCTKVVAETTDKKRLIELAQAATTGGEEFSLYCERYGRMRLPIGVVERLDHDTIEGWALDWMEPDAPADIEIVVGEEVILKLSADAFRPDLLQAGAGSGHHGFIVRRASGILPLSRHWVRVRRARDGRDLIGSPRLVTRPLLDDAAIDFMEAAVGTVLEVATKPDDLAQPLTTVARMFGDIVNAYDMLSRAHIEGPQSSALDVASELHLSGLMYELITRLRHERPPLFFEKPSEPLVSIVIPVYNKFRYTYNCLASISKIGSAASFEVIVVDDGSVDETLLASLVFSGAVRVVRNPQNMGFIGSCNAGASVAKGRFLFFLNNDTLVTEGWLDHLIATFEKSANIGIVGSALLFEDGTLQESGSIVWRLGDGWNWGRGSDPENPAFAFLRDADYVSGAALMIERVLFLELGGFDAMYAPAYYEDTDLAFRVREYGRRVVVQPASRIIHLEGISAGKQTSGPGMKRFQAINQHKFYQRWKDTLVGHRFNGEQPELAAERLVQKRAYFIDDTVPTPDRDAGSNAALEHMLALMELGYKVTFLPADNMAKIEPYTGKLQKVGIECLYHPYYSSVEEVFRKSPRQPDLVYLHRYANAAKYAAMARRYFPHCQIVYNVADLHFLRSAREADLNPHAFTTAQLEALRQSEISAMQSTDCVIVHSSYEAELLRKMNLGIKLQVVPWTIRLNPTNVPLSQRQGSAFLGGFGHPPNVDAVLYMISDILPALRRRSDSQFETYIIGSDMPEIIMRAHVPGLRPLGYVPELRSVLHKLRCTVVPLRYGAGVKGKVLESFAHGLPCVMSEIAAEGLELPSELCWLVAHSPDEFADKLLRIHYDDRMNDAISKAGLAYIDQRYNAEAIKEALRAAVI